MQYHNNVMVVSYLGVETLHACLLLSYMFFQYDAFPLEQSSVVMYVFGHFLNWLGKIESCMGILLLLLSKQLYGNLKGGNIYSGIKVVL